MAPSIFSSIDRPIDRADGLKTQLGPNTWPVVRDKLDHIVRVGVVLCGGNADPVKLAPLLAQAPYFPSGTLGE